MSLVLLIVLLDLVTYGLASAVGAALVAALWLSSARLRRVGGERGARLLLALRAYPPVFGAAAALFLVTPAFLANEPNDHEQRGEIGPALVLLALAALLPVALGLGRGLRANAATRRAERAWKTRSVPIALPEAWLPAARLRHPHAVAAVYGLFRPRLYLGERVLSTFNAGELSATLAHEHAHAASRDNLKAFLLRACPDWLALLPLGRTLEKAWMKAAEEAADDAATRGDARRVVDLASALVKAARLLPPGRRMADLPASFLHGGPLTARIERLLDPRPREDATGRAAWATLIGCLAALLAPLAVPGSSELIYELVEHAVRLAVLVGY